MLFVSADRAFGYSLKSATATSKETTVSITRVVRSAANILLYLSYDKHKSPWADCKDKIENGNALKCDTQPSFTNVSATQKHNHIYGKQFYSQKCLGNAHVIH